MLTPRSFTFFASRPHLTLSGGDFFAKAMEVAGRLGEEIAPARTLRLTLPPILLDKSEDFDGDIVMSQRWYERARDAGFRWVNQPFYISDEYPVEDEKFHIISDIICKNQGIFSSINVSNSAASANGAGLYSKICKALSKRDVHGFNNFRFGVGFNVSQFTPYFPFSHGTETGVALAIESLPLVREVWAKTKDFGAIKTALLTAVTEIEQRAIVATSGSEFPYQGADWSLAPLPNADESVVQLIEHVSRNTIGSGGSTTAISRLTECLKYPLAKGIKGVGFNGVMLSVLEDETLASRFLHRDVTVNDILLSSTVCGCGLDMIPLAGETTEVAIAEYALDTATLAYRLNKPLGVRFLPIKRLRAGQVTEFSHDFVCNSAAVAL